MHFQHQGKKNPQCQKWEPCNCPKQVPLWDEYTEAASAYLQGCARLQIPTANPLSKPWLLVRRQHRTWTECLLKADQLRGTTQHIQADRRKPSALLQPPGELSLQRLLAGELRLGVWGFVSFSSSHAAIKASQPLPQQPEHHNASGSHTKAFSPVKPKPFPPEALQAAATPPRPALVLHFTQDFVSLM